MPLHHGNGNHSDDVNFWHACLKPNHSMASRSEVPQRLLIPQNPLAAGCRCGSNNSAMFADIVPEHLRSTVYAFDRSFEGAVAACAAPLVGKIPYLSCTHIVKPLSHVSTPVISLLTSTAINAWGTQRLHGHCQTAVGTVSHCPCCLTAVSLFAQQRFGALFCFTTLDHILMGGTFDVEDTCLGLGFE